LEVLDVEAELKRLENSIRDFIEYVLRQKYGRGWIDRLEITPERVARWTERKETESKRLSGEELEDRLLYYSDFYDLRTIIKKHWQDGFAEAFGKLKVVEVLLGEMEKLRDPNAHRRELREHQKHLIAGVSGELRIQMMKYRGKREDADKYFPVLEAVSDSLGNKVSNPSYAQTLQSQHPVRVGDEVEIRAFSTDPLGDDLEFSIARIGQKDWSETNCRTIVFREDDIGRTCDIQVMIRSSRSYHAYSHFDDYVQFRYAVLPFSPPEEDG
jgi:hypothetical protein